jgi:hypothetical protein
MLQVDETTVGEHFSLQLSDQCFYIWEYSARQRYDFSPTNQLIANLKIKPNQIAASPRRDYYKQHAIEHSARALRSLIQGDWVEQHGTLVPMPPSKVVGDPDHDDRIGKILRIAFGSFDADIRPLMEQTTSTAADHESTERLSYATLLGLMRIAEGQAHPPRRNIAVVDDVLNSGKHFKVVQHVLSQRFPGIPVIGVFIARCIRPDP